MKIGIYGGSFNPVHNGHVRLAESIVAQGLVDELWMLVSPLNPLKQEERGEMASYEHRLRMAELAVEGLAGVRVSDFESRLPVPSYTYNTLCRLSEAYAEHEFVLVIGADNWSLFPRWYRAKDILNDYNVIMYRRPGTEIDEQQLPGSVRVAAAPLYDISSTQIRSSIAAGHSLTGLIDARVAEYIAEHCLYASKQK